MALLPANTIACPAPPGGITIGGVLGPLGAALEENIQSFSNALGPGPIFILNEEGMDRPTAGHNGNAMNPHNYRTHGTSFVNDRITNLTIAMHGTENGTAIFWPGTGEDEAEVTAEDFANGFLKDCFPNLKRVNLHVCLAGTGHQDQLQPAAPGVAVQQGPVQEGFAESLSKCLGSNVEVWSNPQSLYSKTWIPVGEKEGDLAEDIPWRLFVNGKQEGTCLWENAIRGAREPV